MRDRFRGYVRQAMRNVIQYVVIYSILFCCRVSPRFKQRVDDFINHIIKAVAEC